MTRKWLVVEHIIRNQVSDFGTLLALLPGQVTQRPQKSAPDDTAERLRLLGQAHIHVDPEHAVSLPYDATYKVIRSLVVTDPIEGLKMTQGHLRDLPIDPTDIQLKEALSLIHLNIRAPAKTSGMMQYHEAWGRLVGLLDMHAKLRPTPFTVYLLLKYLRSARGRSHRASNVVYACKKRWGTEIEDYWTHMVRARYAMHDNDDDKAFALLQEARDRLLAHGTHVRGNPKINRFTMRRYLHGWRRFQDLLRRWRYRNPGRLAFRAKVLERVVPRQVEVVKVEDVKDTVTLAPRAMPVALNEDVLLRPRTSPARLFARGR